MQKAMHGTVRATGTSPARYTGYVGHVLRAAVYIDARVCVCVCVCVCVVFM